MSRSFRWINYVGYMTTGIKPISKWKWTIGCERTNELGFIFDGTNVFVITRLHARVYCVHGYCRRLGTFSLERKEKKGKIHHGFGSSFRCDRLTKQRIWMLRVHGQASKCKMSLLPAHVLLRLLGKLRAVRPRSSERDHLPCVPSSDPSTTGRSRRTEGQCAHQQCPGKTGRVGQKQESWPK